MIYWTTSKSPLSCLCICEKLVSLDLSRSLPPFLFCFCVLLLSLLFYAINFTLRITSTSSCSVFGYWSLLITYLMNKSCISSPYFVFFGPLMKTIVEHASNLFFFVSIIFSASSTLSSFLNSLVVLKNYPKSFSNWTFNDDLILFKPLHVLHK